MTILVTGGSGLLGSALQKKASDEYRFIDSSDCDLTNFEATYYLFEEIRPSAVIHTAALVGGIGGNMMKSGDYFRNNIAINTNVLEVSRLLRVDKLISFMSTCVFPNDIKYPLKAEYLHNGPPHPSNYGYAYAKRMLAVQSSAYRDQWGCNFITLVPPNMYGPNDNFNLVEGHVVPALIHKAYLSKESRTPLAIWGSGSALREFVHSSDIAEVTASCLESYNSSDPLLISSGLETSIAELAKEISEIFRIDEGLVFDASKPDGQLRKPSDTSIFKMLFHDFEFKSIRCGLQETIEWFLKEYPRIRS